MDRIVACVKIMVCLALSGSALVVEAAQSWPEHESFDGRAHGTLMVFDLAQSQGCQVLNEAPLRWGQDSVYLRDLAKGATVVRQEAFAAGCVMATKVADVTSGASLVVDPKLRALREDGVASKSGSQEVGMSPGYSAEVIEPPERELSRRGVSKIGVPSTFVYKPQASTLLNPN